jgi:hypothetical protein
MANTFKSGSNTSGITNSLFKNNFTIGLDISGPTVENTGYYNGITPPSGGYTIYQLKPVQGPSIRVASDDSELITIAKQYGASDAITTKAEALSYFNSQNDIVVTNFDYENIVTSGLQLNTDAGFVSSYPTTASTWYDISGNGYNGTLVSNPTFTSANSGSFILDGVDEFIRVDSSGFFLTSGNSFFADTGYAWTVSAWFKFPVSPVGTRTGNASFTILGQSGGIGGAETLTVFVNSGTDSTYGTAPYYLMVGIRGTKTTISTGSMNTGAWNQVVVTWNGTSGKAYLNGNDRGATNIGTAAKQTGYFFDIGETGDTGAPANSTQQFEGNISNVLVYNRALSAEEVTQNFNALKGRFGL